MKLHSNQFGTRENTASSRQHAPRCAAHSKSNPNCVEEENPKTELPALQNDYPATGIETPLHSVLPRPSTDAEARNENQLLTVHEVAKLLQVPVSWVYEHTRRRSTDRIPGFRLGKYWRFVEEDVVAWLAAKSRNGYHHA
jgi:excisionase family DNA binding protein